MPTISAVPAVKNALVTTLAARAGLNGVSVTYSWPGTSMPAGGGSGAIEAIFLGATDVQSHIPSMKAGRKLRQEEFTQDCVIWVIQPGGSPEDAATPDLMQRTLSVTSAVRCAECHEQLVKEWKTSAHAIANRKPLYVEIGRAHV